MHLFSVFKLAGDADRRAKVVFLCADAVAVNMGSQRGGRQAEDRGWPPRRDALHCASPGAGHHEGNQGRGEAAEAQRGALLHVRAVPLLTNGPARAAHVGRGSGGGERQCFRHALYKRLQTKNLFCHVMIYAYICGAPEFVLSPVEIPTHYIWLAST